MVGSGAQRSPWGKLMPKIATAALTLLVALAAPAFAQQVVDPNADTAVTDPAFAPGKGPVVLVDSGHADVDRRRDRGGEGRAHMMDSGDQD